MRLGYRFFEGCMVHPSSVGKVGLVVLAGALAAGCPLKDPVPVTPDYPPEPPFSETARDAGKE